MACILCGSASSVCGVGQVPRPAFPARFQANLTVVYHLVDKVGDAAPRPPFASPTQPRCKLCVCVCACVRVGRVCVCVHAPQSPPPPHFISKLYFWVGGGRVGAVCACACTQDAPRR
jgi:hypothetical protein